MAKAKDDERCLGLVDFREIGMNMYEPRYSGDYQNLRGESLCTKQYNGIRVDSDEFRLS